MAKLKVNAGESISKMLDNLGKATDGIAKMAIYEGAKVVTDDLKGAINDLPEDNERYLKGKDEYRSITKIEKKDLIDGLGISKIDVNEKGNYSTNVSVSGYGSVSTRKYPKGVPNVLIARSIESGSSVRRKNPFWRKTVKSVTPKAQKVMEEKINEEIKKITR